MKQNDDNIDPIEKWSMRVYGEHVVFHLNECWEV